MYSTTLATESAENPEVLQEIHIETLTSGKCGNNATYSFNSATGTLTISGMGDMAGYGLDVNTQTLTMPRDSYRNKIESVVIGDGITSIGGRAFFECSSLISVTFPNSVTSIDIRAFLDFESLTTVYYEGNEEERRNIDINSDGNNQLVDANWIYNNTSTTNDMSTTDRLNEIKSQLPYTGDISKMNMSAE